MSMKRSYTTMYYIFIMLCMVTLSSCGDNSSPENFNKSATPKATITIPIDSATTIDTISLGRMQEGEIVTSHFAVSNNSTKNIVIENIYVNCNCTETTYDKSPIVVGESRIVEFSFKSAGRGGEQIKSMEVKISDNQTFKVIYIAEVTPKQ